MKFDITKLSLIELHNLEKEIAKEKKSREGIVYKSDLGIAGDLANSNLKQNLINSGLYYVPEDEGENCSVCEVWSSIFDMEKHIYKLCDVTLGNYTLQQTPKRGSMVKGIRCNGSAIAYNVDPIRYKHMAKDICEVVKKYSEVSE